MHGWDKSRIRKRRSPTISKCMRTLYGAKASASAAKGRAESLTRPLTSLIRESRPVRILLQAIRGNPTCGTRSSEKDFTCAIRIVTNCAVPQSFYSSISVCGSTKGDVSNDIGLHSVLGNLRKMSSAAFDVNVLLCRLLVPLRDSVQDAALRQCLTDKIVAFQLSRRSTESQGMCWSSNLPDINGGHIRQDIFNLVRIILQGPVLQFVRKSDTT